MIEFRGDLDVAPQWTDRSIEKRGRKAQAGKAKAAGKNKDTAKTKGDDSKSGE
ncbi:MAG: hypothetical protein NTW86_00445 [Candidatus Sumerlaeota bacterium]|nr:hypothetical protein [Candidatus Sumerlaeota bacterium]